MKRNKGNQFGVQRGHQGGPRGFHHCIKKTRREAFSTNGNEHLSLGLKG